MVSLLGHAKGTDSLPYMLRLVKAAPASIRLPRTYRKLQEATA